MADNRFSEQKNKCTASSRYEAMKNLTPEEAPAFIRSMIYDLCESGLPSLDMISEWLGSQPAEEV